MQDNSKGWGSRRAIVLIGLLLILCACTAQQENRLQYEKEGRTYSSSLITELEPAMRWVKNTLPKDAVITAWWDYGHMIRGYTGNQVIIFSPMSTRVLKIFKFLSIPLKSFHLEETISFWSYFFLGHKENPAVSFLA